MIESNPCSRRQLLAATAVGWFARTHQDPTPEPALHSRTVVIVRHAEKDLTDKKDPELSDLGRERADRLASWFQATGVRALYATDYRRTQQTLRPLAEQSGTEIRTYSARDSKDFATEFTELAHGTDGDTVVVAGHSNTVPEMVAALGGTLSNLDDKGWLADDEYERVVIVTLCGTKGRRMRAANTVDLRMQI